MFDINLVVTQGVNKRLVVLYPGNVTNAIVKSQIRDTQYETGNLLAEFSKLSVFYNSTTNRTRFVMLLSAAVTRTIPATNDPAYWYGDFFIDVDGNSPLQLFSYDVKVNERVTAYNSSGTGTIDETTLFVSQDLVVSIAPLEVALDEAIAEHNADIHAHPNLTPSAGVASFNTRTGSVTLTSGDVTAALGYTPLQTINSSDVTTALGYTPIQQNQVTYETTFTNSQLNISGVYPLTHNLNTYPSSVYLWDNTGEQILPARITYTTANAIAIDLSDFYPISGTWRVSLGV